MISPMGSPVPQPAMDIRSLIDMVPAFVWYASPDGSIEFLNQRGLAYTGFTLEQIRGWNWRETNILHPDDIEDLFREWSAIIASGQEGEIQARMRRSDGEYRWFLFRVAPVYDSTRSLLGWLGVDLEIDEHKHSQDQLQRSESYLAAAQKLSHTGSFGWNVSTGDISWSEETFRIVGWDRGTKPTLDLVLERVHPEDALRVKQTLEQALRDQKDFDFEHRLLMPDGSVKHVRAVGQAPKDGSEFVGAVMDITSAKQIEEKLRQDEKELRTIIETIPAFVYSARPDGSLEFITEHWMTSWGFTFEEWKDWGWVSAVHPDDLERVMSSWQKALMTGEPLELELRTGGKGGRGPYRWGMARCVPLRDAGGNIIKWYGTFHDLEERKQAEEKLQQSEKELRRIVDFVPSIIFVLSPDGKVLFANEACSEYTGVTKEELASIGFGGKLSHPEDAAKYRPIRAAALSRGEPFQAEQRLLGKDGCWRWFLFQYNPLKDEGGRVDRWYVTATDIDKRKAAEDDLKAENLALREEINSTSMFEEIIGGSKAISRVLTEISKVATTDSTVLILGETGTGKELIARAIHKRSGRADQAFISVNCGAIPRDLVASELFGHEKGAFTGATQRRLGRFELAAGGTIFLDEVGELPSETQVALLRVLQEHEFERVGGTGSIRTNVRLIAATNRDLHAAIAEGTFRSDLFYRLNVFPVEIPPLRDRKEDIPMLVEYFIDRFARRAGKRIREISRKSLDLLQSYPWPGNIRELQNVIERSVILCETETFSVDESWLSRYTPTNDRKNLSELAEKLAAQEKEMIESALRESGGQVFGPSGAAAKLGMPRSTLESKIRSLKINKNQFKA